MGFSDERLATLAGRRRRARWRARADALDVHPGLQAHRHLRGGVRLAHRLYVLDLRDRLRRRAGYARRGRLDARQDHHSRRRPEPHRPGHRVRLLLLPRRLRAVRRRLRDHHGQLQSGNGLDRLRHIRPALFRAAHRRGRAGDRPHRADERHGEGRHRAVRRPDPAQARRRRWKRPTCRSSAPRPTPSTWPKTATASRR